MFGAALPPLIEAAGVWGALRVLAAVTLLISAVAAALFTVPGEGGGVVGRLRAATRAVHAHSPARNTRRSARGPAGGA